MSTLWQNISSKMLRSGSKLYLLIGINVIVYLAINIPAVVEWLFTGSMDVITYYSNEYLALPAYLPKLLVRFWTPLTYMFMHAGIFHILFNMLWLYWIGQIFEEFSGYKRTVGLYLMGGFAGALFYILSYNFFPVFAAALPLSTAVGASASVMAVIVATATLLPDYTIPLFIIGPVKLKWIAIAYVVFDFISIAGPNSGGEIAHLGGALIGFVYIKRLQKGHDWISSITNLFKSGPRLSNLKVVARNTAKKGPSRPRQEDVDRILDKISTNGYESLNKEEKEILFRASKNES
ncbi:rhomboid family intramembrane serine protease [Mucilaginibacter sp. X5P1]|uniref:rhomboid family intramembrane serine protease n=1 Tax=Mucilaginibacter sp. X5P1 TaxID=2723088 RepID=UPI00160A8067|nr:rhomboid family intramembrane serine protease [Mucilaginibacter sp. X5P1]MBB6139669.1 membrane associated rhomboid family serine protease [Mucilaginibacter sp. X5P1]